MASGEVIEGHETARIGEGSGWARGDGEREQREKTQFCSRKKGCSEKKRGRVEERKTEAGVVFWWFLAMCSRCRSLSLFFLRSQRRLGIFPEPSTADPKRPSASFSSGPSLTPRHNSKCRFTPRQPSNALCELAWSVPSSSCTM